jgi:hypothetical protein
MYKQNLHPRFTEFNRPAAIRAYRKQCSELAVKFVADKAITTVINRIKKKMRNKNLKALTKKVTNNHINSIRSYSQSQKRYKMKSTIANLLNAQLAETAMYQALALGPGGLSKFDRQRKAATRAPNEHRKIIPIMHGDSTEKQTTHRRKLQRLGPIAGIRTSRTTCMKGTPAWKSAEWDTSVQGMIQTRIDEQCRAKYWDDLDSQGIIGISLNAEDGKPTVNFQIIIIINSSCLFVFLYSNASSDGHGPDARSHEIPNCRWSRDSPIVHNADTYTSCVIIIVIVIVVIIVIIIIIIIITVMLFGLQHSTTGLTLLAWRTSNSISTERHYALHSSKAIFSCGRHTTTLSLLHRRWKTYSQIKDCTDECSMHLRNWRY